jgi:hypothetical protein
MTFLMTIGLSILLPFVVKVLFGGLIDVRTVVAR